MTGKRELSQALRALEAASREEPIRQWRRFYKSAPPRYASRDFLVRAISYAMQEQEFGGLRAPARRELLAIAKGESVSAQASRIKIKPGARLLREWHGTTHEVLVTDQGFVWGGATYVAFLRLPSRLRVPSGRAIGFSGWSKAQGRQWLSASISAARSTRANRPRRALSRISTPSMRSARPARPILRARHEGWTVCRRI